MPQSEFSSRGASNRPKVFLGDLEYAKKEEWERRRKLRLKQVRQQARDIASIIRNQTGNARKKIQEQKKCVLQESAAKSTETCKVELQQKLTECLTSVGTGHSTAAMMTEVDQLLQHKIELQDTLARVRGELAVEKAKETRKPRQELVECPREGISVSKMKSAKVAPQKPVVRKMSPPKMKPSATVPATPPNLMNISACVESKDQPRDVDDSVVQLPAEKTIFSPPFLARKRSKKPDRSPVNGRKSCPPITASVEGLDSSPDTDDSGQTWPPVSVRKKKSTKVRMYDHSARKCSEYAQKCEVIRMDHTSPSIMKDLMHKEEVLLSKKTEGELESRKVELQRGLRALRQEVAKQDFDAAIRDLCLGSKERRYRKARTYQPSAGSDLNRNSVQAGSGDRQKASNSDGPHDGLDSRSLEQSSKHRPPAPAATDTIQSIVTKLAEQREAILQDPSVRTDGSTSSTDGSEDESARLPLWIQAESNAQNAEKYVPDRVPTPETAMHILNGTKKGSPNTETNNVSSDLSSFIRHEQEFEQSESTNSPKQQKDKGSSKSVSQDDRSSSNSSNLNKSSSSAEIHVKVQIRRESAVKRLSLQTPHKEDESSTSYYSPPEKLSPQQISVLRDVLSKMSIKNRNPVLHHYITRVLEMSRQSLSDLEVSGCSDFSIQSELFSDNKVPSSRKSNGVVNKQNRKTAKSRICLKEIDNLSTAGTVCSSPRTDSIGEVPSPNYSDKIVELLRNIMEIQRVYNQHTSSDPSSAVVSDSHSSYHSVPSGIDAKHYHGVAPAGNSTLNYCEDTGIFVNRQDASQGAEHATLASLLNGHYFKLPAELLPNPFTENRREGHVGLNRQSACPEFSVSDDVPDGYSRKPDMDPGSIFIPRRGANKVFSTLSDIESVVSSIQSTPTKNVARPTSPAGSLPADDASSASRFSSREFISSQELQDNDLINLTSSSSDFEDVFQSLGLGWALSTLRRTRTSKNLRAEDSSSKSGSLPSSEKTKSGAGYHHSTPVKGSSPGATQVSPETDHVPSLTPPNIALLCPSWQK